MDLVKIVWFQVLFYSSFQFSRAADLVIDITPNLRPHSWEFAISLCDCEWTDHQLTHVYSEDYASPEIIPNLAGDSESLFSKLW